MRGSRAEAAVSQSLLFEVWFLSMNKMNEAALEASQSLLFEVWFLSADPENIL
jgi:hypothetical protein